MYMAVSLISGKEYFLELSELLWLGLLEQLCQAPSPSRLLPSPTCFQPPPCFYVFIYYSLYASVDS